MPFSSSGRFRLLGKLGEGGMGIVYDAYDRRRDMRVALKVLRCLDAGSIYRFKREFRALSDLSHPNLVALYDLVSENDDWGLTMEMIDGQDFISYVRKQDVSTSERRMLLTPSYDPERSVVTETLDTGLARELERPGVAPVSPSETAPPLHERLELLDIVDVQRLKDALRQLAQALEALHNANIIHRDLKPSNIRITRRGRLVLMDFGIVAEMGRPLEANSNGARVGTPTFMAPEQAQGKPPTTAADWYSFGVILYIALSGRRPFDGTREDVLRAKQARIPLPPSVFIDGVPARLERLCMQLLQPDPERRIGGNLVMAQLGAQTPRHFAPSSISLSTGQEIFVGRDRELGLLGRVHEQVCRGKAHLALIEGPSGIGKTALVDRFVAKLRGAGVLSAVAAARCHERESLSYKALDGVIDDLANYLLAQPEDQRGDLVPENLGAIAVLFPTLRQVPECDATEASRQRDPAERRARAAAGLRELFGALAGRGTVLVRIEDLHCADRESLELLADVLAAPGPSGLLVVATSRQLSPEGEHHLATLVGELERVDACSRIELGPLSDRAQSALMRELQRSQPGVGAPDRRLWAEAAGHPMLLAELARCAHEDPDELRRASALGLGEIIYRRISGLNEKPRHLLEAVAVAGEPIPLRVVASAAGLSATERERALAVLRIARLARRRSRNRELVWVDAYHGKVREAVIEHMSDDRHVALHRVIASALEQWPDASRIAVAKHYQAAGDLLPAAQHLIEAARAAADSLANERATELYCGALEVLSRIAASGAPRSDDGDGPGGHEMAEEVEVARYRASVGLADCLILLGREHEASELLEGSSPGIGKTWGI